MAHVKIETGRGRNNGETAAAARAGADPYVTRTIMRSYSDRLVFQDVVRRDQGPRKHFDVKTLTF